MVKMGKIVGSVITALLGTRSLEHYYAFVSEWNLCCNRFHMIAALEHNYAFV